MLGKPATYISLTNFRTYARNRGSVNWNCNTYQIQRKLFWLFAVEYANFNSQAEFNAQPTGEGYKQGGLGAGVTILDGTLWNAFNGYYPVIPCGTTNPLGNRSGVVDYIMPAEYGTLTVQVPSYRGIENPFGHLWKWTDGCKCLIQSDADGGQSEFYECDNPANFTSSGVTNYQLRGNLPRTEGYIKEVIMGEYGEIMPLLIGGGSTTYFVIISIPASPILAFLTWRFVRRLRIWCECGFVTRLRLITARCVCEYRLSALLYSGCGVSHHPVRVLKILKLGCPLSWRFVQR